MNPFIFVFETPLYEPISNNLIDKLIPQNTSHALNFDGYCIECQREVPYYFINDSIRSGPLENWIASYLRSDKQTYFSFESQCQRRRSHIIKTYCHHKAGQESFFKVGQYPSTADLSISQINLLRKVSPREEINELRRGVGLAAHNIGIGSFVYLRRVFERIILRHYIEGKSRNGKMPDPTGLRMDQKIEQIADALPAFLVENKKIYGFLSKGIHELNEDECLSYFGVLKSSIFMILEQDEENRRKRVAEQELKEQLAKLDQTRPA